MEAFVNENLPWIIAAGALILLTIIGYFAEKTDFGKKRAVSEDKGKKNKKKEKEEINEVQPTVIDLGMTNVRSSSKASKTATIGNT